MPKDKYLDITLVVDRSGSMYSCQSGTIEGFNHFISEQKKLLTDRIMSQCLVSLVLFDHEYTPMYTARSIMDVPYLGSPECPYTPRGNTALHGAVGQTIDSLGARLSAMPEHQRPERVMFVTITDGLENSSPHYEWSRRYSGYRVAEMTRHQESKYSWQFVYMGANQNALLEAQQIGIMASNAINYKSSDIGTRAAFGVLANAAKHYTQSAEKTSGNFFGGQQDVDEDEKEKELLKNLSLNVDPSVHQRELTSSTS